jgi:hypothetical protein
MKDLSLKHELDLVHEIMSTIERFNNDHAIDPAPAAIRDTLLAVAGLLHREAIRVEGQEDDPRQLQRTFGEAAQARIEQVLKASTRTGRNLPQ